MFKGNRKYYWVLGIVFAGIVAVEYMRPIPISWLKTYLSRDKAPFGSYAIFKLLEGTYAQKVEINKQTIYNLQEQNNYQNTTLLLVNDNMEFSKLDVKKAYEFMQAGNKLCVAAGGFRGLLADTFKIKTSDNWSEFFQNMDSALKKSNYSVRYLNPKNNLLKHYAYPEAAAETHFTSFDTAQFRIMAVNDKNDPVLIKAIIGRGELYLSTVPDAFANVFIVKHPNRPFVYTLLSCIRNQRLLWDEHYKTFNPTSEHPLKYIFDSDALYVAYCILLLGVLFFMFFSVKRKQRAIAIVEPLKNSTLEFVDVVSHVYFNSRNHKHIAAETIHYFYFDIRNKFYLQTNTLNEEFYIALSKLSGVTREEVKKLFDYCESLKRASELTEYDLLELNKRINDFKQKSIR